MEKPSLEKAQSYLASGDYVWNTRIFIWSADAIIKAFEKYAPEIANIFAQGVDSYNTETEREFINTNYPNSPNISIDYAILEKADNEYAIPADIGWSDLGTWTSLHHVIDKDENGNASSCEHINLSNTKD